MLKKKNKITGSISKEHITTGFGVDKQIVPTLYIEKEFTVGKNILYVNSGNNRVGINTCTPGATLEVNGSVIVSGNIFVEGGHVGGATNFSLGSVGNSPNGNGATYSGGVLRLQPANEQYPGLLTASAQIISGNKTFLNGIKLPSIPANMPLQLDSNKNVVAQAVNINTQTTGVLPVSKGGTGSSATLTGGKYMISRNGTIVEGASIINTKYDSISAILSGLTSSPFVINYSVEKISTNVCSLTFTNNIVTITLPGPAVITENLPAQFRPTQNTVLPIIIQNGTGISLGRILIAKNGGMTIYGSISGSDWSIGNGGFIDTCVSYRLD